MLGDNRRQGCKAAGLSRPPDPRGLDCPQPLPPLTLSLQRRSGWRPVPGLLIVTVARVLRGLCSSAGVYFFLFASHLRSLADSSQPRSSCLFYTGYSFTFKMLSPLRRTCIRGRHVSDRLPWPPSRCTPCCPPVAAPPARKEGSPGLL